MDSIDSFSDSDPSFVTASSPASAPPSRGAKFFLVRLVALVALAVVGYWEIRLDALNGELPMMRPAAGVAIWLLLRFGFGMWPGLALATLVADGFSPNISLLAAAGLMVAKTGGALAGAWLWRRVRTRWPDIVGDVAACLIAPLGAAVVGASLAVLAGDTMGGWSRSWLTWWTGSLLGALTILPVLLALPSGWSERPRWRWKAIAKFLATLAVLAVASALAFVYNKGGTYLFAVFPALLLASLWFGAPGARLAALLVAVAGLSAELTSLGGADGDAVSLNLLHLHIFLTSVAVTAIVLPLYRLQSRLVLPVWVLLGGWLVSGSIYATLELNGRERREEIFRDRVTAAEAAIQVRITSYVDAIRGGVSFYTASQVVERDEWRAYIESVQMRTRYPGMNGLGIIFPVEPNGIEAWKTRMRSIGYPNPDVRPFPGTNERPGATKYVVTLLEPVELNTGSIGRDISTDPSRREAAERARDTGEPHISRRVPGSRDTQRRAGLLLYVPIYSKGAPISTVEERRRAHLGWVYAQFFPDTFLAGALGPMGETLSLHFFEDGEFTRQTLLYATDQPIRVEGSNLVTIGSGPLPVFARVTHLQMAGQRFQLGWQRGPHYVSADSAQLAWVGCSSALATLLLSGLVLNLKSSGLRAEQLVEARTRELTATQARLQGVLDGAAFSIISTRPDGTIMTCNAGTETMLGYTRDELEGRMNLVALHLPAELETRPGDLAGRSELPSAGGYEALVAQARHGRAEDREWTYVRKDGTAVPVLLSLTPLHDATGALDGFLAIAQDLTEQKKAEGALRASEERLQHVLRQAECVVWEASVTLGAIDWNWRTTVYDSGLFTRLTGEAKPRTDASPWQAFEIFEQGEMDARSRRAMETGEGGFIQEFRLRRAGQVTWLRESVAVTRIAPGVFWLVGVAIDITAQKDAEASHKSLERQLRQSQKMEAIGTLAGGIAHDFNNILAGIFGFTALARAEATGEPVLEDYLDEIARASQRAAQLVRQILAFSRAQKGVGTIGPVSLARVVGEAGTLLRATCPATIEFVSDVPADLPAVEGDETQLHQVVMNLATNAVYAMRERSGRLTIRLDVVTVEASLARSLPGLAPGLCVRLTVVDTGPGIAPQIQERIFEPFFTTKGPGEGSGLGLSVVHGIVRDHRGAIRLFSQPGYGATFEVFLPAMIAGSAGEMASVPALANNRGSGERILFVEDEVTVARAGSLALERLGYSIVLEPDGQLAQQRFERDPNAFDLVITDQTMPGLTGLELAARIHARRSDLPIIIASGHSSMLEAKAMAAVGVRELLAKPYSIDELAAAVRRQLGPTHAGLGAKT